MNTIVIFNFLLLFFNRDEFKIFKLIKKVKPNSTRSEIKAKEVCVWKPSSKLTDAESKILFYLKKKWCWQKKLKLDSFFKMVISMIPFLIYYWLSK